MTDLSPQRMTQITDLVTAAGPVLSASRHAPGHGYYRTLDAITAIIATALACPGEQRE